MLIRFGPVVARIKSLEIKSDVTKPNSLADNYIEADLRALGDGKAFQDGKAEALQDRKASLEDSNVGRDSAETAMDRRRASLLTEQLVADRADANQIQMPEGVEQTGIAQRRSSWRGTGASESSVHHVVDEAVDSRGCGKRDEAHGLGASRGNRSGGQGRQDPSCAADTPPGSKRLIEAEGFSRLAVELSLNGSNPKAQKDNSQSAPRPY